MSQEVLVKVYGHIWPSGEALHQALDMVCTQALPSSYSDEAILSREGDMSRISFEGIFFPDDDCLDALRQHLEPQHQGKLDILDLENWRLIRHIFSQGHIISNIAPLNNVLDYSGH